MKNSTYYKRLLIAVSPLLIVLLAVSSSFATVKLEFWTNFGAGPSLETLNQLVQQFNSTHPSIQVRHRGVPGDLGEQYQMAIVAGIPPDLGWVGPDWFINFYDTDILVPVDELAVNDDFDTEQFWPGLWDEDKYKGHQWGVPFEVGSEALMYNKDKFAYSGIAEAPETWSEFVNVGKKLTDADSGQYSFHLWGFPYMSVQWIWRNNGSLVSEDLRRVTFTDPRTVDALQWYGDLVVNHRIAGGSFADGSAAMMVTHAGWYGQFKDFSFEADASYPPISETGTRASLNYYKELVIFRSTPEKEQAAWTFVKWLMEPENLAHWAVETGYLPVSQTALGTDTYQHYLQENPKLLAWIEELAYLRGFPYLTSWGQILELFGQASSAVRSGQASAATALEGLQGAAQAILDREWARIEGIEDEDDPGVQVGFIDELSNIDEWYVPGGGAAKISWVGNALELVSNGERDWGECRRLIDVNASRFTKLEVTIDSIKNGRCVLAIQTPLGELKWSGVSNAGVYTYDITGQPGPFELKVFYEGADAKVRIGQVRVIR